MAGRLAVWGSGIEGAEDGECCREQRGPGVVAGVAEPDLAATADQGGGDGVQPVPEASGFPPTGVVVG